eukprot:scaffold9143_cov87-Phaeocystis_antarctica.AAC.2
MVLSPELPRGSSGFMSLREFTGKRMIVTHLSNHTPVHEIPRRPEISLHSPLPVLSSLPARTATRLWQSSSCTALQHVVRRAPEARALRRGWPSSGAPTPQRHPCLSLFGALQGIRRSTKGRTTGGGVDFASLTRKFGGKKDSIRIAASTRMLSDECHELNEAMHDQQFTRTTYLPLAGFVTCISPCTK